MTSSETSLSRYARQTCYAPIGTAGQQRILQSRILVCGCGALGSVLANTLARSGVGHLRIVDRDFLELNNLQRQVLYDEQDVASGLPKAIAAANRLRKINSQIEIEPVVADVDHRNIRELVQDVDVIVDGTDNFDIRFLLNDISLETNIPWVYGGCIGAEGQTMTVVPSKTACLRCLMADAPPPGTTPTCDTAGILGPIINVIASMQAAEALKLVCGKEEAICCDLRVIDLWDNRLKQINLQPLLESKSCPACFQGERLWLHGERGSQTAVLCGRNAVQLSFPERSEISLPALAEKLARLGNVTVNPFLLKATIDEFQLSVFPDGRAIIGGTEEISVAKSVYARYIGN
ncbi:MAG: ThiF family adenylyltransferase [Planctomycetales bacterium]|nr:ThiF family adenylyltransferase [Planctomycetales bacterium]